MNTRTNTTKTNPAPIPSRKKTTDRGLNSDEQKRRTNTAVVDEENPEWLSYGLGDIEEDEDWDKLQKPEGIADDHRFEN